jgi:uncharacterized membrane protein
MPIRNPIEWTLGQVGVLPPDTAVAAPAPRPRNLAPPLLRHIGLEDIGAALRAGFADFAASRTDVIVLCVVYPVVGLLLARLAFGENVLPLLFPMAAGFALLGPLFAVGLNEMSRLREEGQSVGWADAFGVARAPAFGAILALGLVLVAIFLAWLVAAGLIYHFTLGPRPPISVGQFTHDVLTTPRGWAMIVVGCGAGFVFAALVLTIGAISFPMLLDRGSSIEVAMATSVRAMRENPVTMASWGLVVGTLLVLGSLPLFLGLTIVLPVLGHATWHLYRRLVVA